MRLQFRTSALAALAMFAAACSGAPTSPSALKGGAPAATLASGAPGAAAQRSGINPVQLQRAGWTCFDVPGLGVHCQPPGSTASSATIPFQVFDTSNPNDANARFVGTELLIRQDLYSGQPCPQEHGEYILLPFGYYACHHYDPSVLH